MWVLDHLADIESDFAVFHRVADPLALSGPEFFRKAHRLAAYSGVLAARVAAAQEHSAPRTTGARGGERREEVSLDRLTAMHPDLIERG
jgi:hypothetical protein